MNCRLRLFVFVVLTIWSGLGALWAQSGVSAPILKWQYGGCLVGPFCQTGWHSSPAVADLDNDGQPDVIWGAGDVVALNGANGSLKWRAPSASRVWPGVAVADLTGDGTLEVIVGRNSDQLTVYDRFGSVIWTRNPFGGGEIRTLAVADLENDGQLEIVVGRAAGVQSRQVNVFAPNGTVRSGWPARHSGEPGFGGGMWNANVAVADMNGDGFKEVFGPNGSHYITALDRNGSQLRVNGIYAPRQFWSEVGVHVDHDVDLRGWVNCGVEHRPDFSMSAPVIGDVDGNGIPEMIVVGNVRNCATSPYTDLYHMPFIFNLDRTRWSGSGFDWTAIPTPGPGSGPRSEDAQVIENAVPNAVLADLDGDGLTEILFPSYDGKVHAYWLDKTEHGSWPYTVPTSGASGDDFRFASEPSVADLNDDGQSEVIFTSWPKKATGQVAQIHIVSAQGVELHRINLPAPATGATWNGGLGAPTIANIDSDSDVELVVGTVASGLVAYDLPNTARARVLWGTGRGNYQRTGVPVTASVTPPPDSTPPAVNITSPTAGATVSGTITVSASASGNVDVAGVQFFADGLPLGTEDTTAPHSRPWDTTAIANGSHVLTARARDAAGNTTTSAAVTVTVSNADTTPPAVGITSPTAGATVSGTLTVNASASDNVGVAGVQFFVDGLPLGTEDAATPYSRTWDTTAIANGSHVLTARARDAAGNTTTSAAVTVTVSNADTTPPAVGITSPTAGATVSGTLTVKASASDNVGVAGVQFFVDGSPLGTEDTTAPFEVAWDTATVNDGAHTLTALAGDGAGNTTTSAAVSVTVANGTGGQVTRLEDTSTAIAYTPAGAWIEGYTDARGWSGGTAALGFALGQRATLAFSGTGVSWIGLRGPQTGIANLYVDGTLVATVDAYAPTETVQAVLYTASGLAMGAHTLMIEVTRTKNDASADYYVVVDAFDVTSPGGGPGDTTPPAVNITSPQNGATVFGAAMLAANASDNVGVAGVQFFVDGAPLGAEDIAAPFSATWDTTTAALGSHTLTAVARDGAGHSTTSAGISVTVASGPGTSTRLEDGNTAITYYGGWNLGNAARPWSGGTAAVGFALAQRAVLDFRGTGVSWIGFRASWVGIANVYVDGTLAGTVDPYAPTETVGAVLFTASGLAPGPHTIAIEVTRTRNPSSTDYVVFVDAFDVYDAPPDSTAPAVAITSPGDGGAVSGTVPITASASDDTGVAGVTFFVDGTQVGAIDTLAPHFINWTTTGVTDGTHTLTAVARDPAGNTATSAPVTVTVSNAAPPTTSTATRVENTDLSITYVDGCATCGQSPTWFHGSRSRSWSGGTSSFNRADGAGASFTFAGTSISWIGFRAAWAGIARVYVDGAFVTEVDLYSPAEQVQVPVFRATDLAAGTHTIAVESTGRKNPDASDYAVVVDAFDVSPAMPPTVASTRVEEDAPPMTFTAGWIQGDTTQAWSGGTAAVSGTTGERATFDFTGTSVSWVGLRAPGMGIARLYLDGAFQAEVDTYAPRSIQGTVFTITGLAAARHRLELEVTGRRHASATGSTIAVDGFDIRSRLEEMHPAVTYSGLWSFDNTDRNWSGTSLNTGSGTAARSTTAGARADFAFTGTSVSWIGYRGASSGMADVYLDGAFTGRFDLYAPAEQLRVPIYSASGLTAGPHTLRIEATGTKNAASAAASVRVDAFDVTVPEPAPPVARVQETDPGIAYTSGWTQGGQSVLWSGEDARQAMTVGAQATFTFTGTSLRWLGARGFATGVARVTLDGQVVATIDTRTTLQEEYQAVLYSVSGLAGGNHTVTIEVVGRNGEPPGTSVEAVVLDAFDIQ